MSGTASCTGSRGAATRDRTGRRSRRGRRGSQRCAEAPQAAGRLRHERRGDALAVGLAERPEPHRGRDQVGERRRAGTPAGPARSGMSWPAAATRDRDRIGDRLGPRRLQERPAPGRARLRSDRADEGVALRRRLELPLGGGRERQRERGDLGEPCAVAAPAPVGRGEQDRVVAADAEGEQVAEPGREARRVASRRRPRPPIRARANS